ncbi:hypothetical protein IEN31_004419 [Salmonella enterica subsp. enterica serovar Typhi]|nr:hypothetical protein [Salmonella enterica]HCB6241389.1 hypothetical protein [Salmonella enterica subsp. enterica serovar Typhi str. CT18]ECF4341813.1 hypothetical protein [Salmonella enterica subsp. enterica serovar Typhi]ECM6421266.1 hypothetical protein [Salmonella enterica subsp. enterica serovar Typhi]EDN5824912.1 hypothetical protein [Salmonella enterica subsp. enterica serovar Typhi]EDU3373555.1 hypothetical protein [Salmonella enterica subsp. enterica serovar Typhi]
MMNVIKANLIYIMIGFSMMALAYGIAGLFGDVFISNHSLIVYALAPLIPAGYLFAVSNIAILVFKLLHILYLWLDLESNNEDVSKAKCDRKRLRRSNNKRSIQ